MAITTSTNVPASFRAGDTTQWTVSYSDYPATSWELRYYFRRDGEESITFLATADGSDYDVNLTGEDTGKFSPGRWRWYARARLQSSGEIIAGQGTVTVKPDPSKDHEPTHAEKMVAAIRAVQLKRAGEAFNSTDISGTSMDRKTDAELIEALNYWQSQVNRERARRESVETGLPRRKSRIWLKS